MDPLSLAIIAASAFAKYQANEDAADSREAFRRSMEAYQRTKAKDTQVATDALLAKQTPKAREEELQTITGDREKSLRDTVGAAQAFDAPPIAGKLGGDYKATQEADAERIAERTRRAIEQLSTMGAPGEQAQAFSRRFGKAAGDVDANNRASENVGRGYLDDISRVVPDPTTMMLGDIGMAVGSSMGGGAGGGGEAMGADTLGNFTYEDSAGNLQHSAFPYPAARTKVNSGLGKALSLWGK